MSKKLAEIKRILRDHPVTDPRGALDAIEGAIKTKSPVKKVRPLLVAKLTANAEGTGGEIEVIVSRKQQFVPNHLRTLIMGLNEFGNERFGGCGEADCEACNPTAETGKPFDQADLDRNQELAQMFAKIGAVIRAKLEAKVAVDNAKSNPEKDSK